MYATFNLSRQNTALKWCRCLCFLQIIIIRSFYEDRIVLIIFDLSLGLPVQGGKISIWVNRHFTQLKRFDMELPKRSAGHSHRRSCSSNCSHVVFRQKRLLTCNRSSELIRSNIPWTLPSGSQLWEPTVIYDLILTSDIVYTSAIWLGLQPHTWVILKMCELCDNTYCLQVVGTVFYKLQGPRTFFIVFSHQILSPNLVYKS